MSSDEMNFCKDCKHYKSVFYDVNCNHPKNGIDVVTGEIINLLAGRCRLNEDKCGHSGKWFEKILEEEIEPEKKKIIEEPERSLQFMTVIHENMYAKTPEKESWIKKFLRRFGF